MISRTSVVQQSHLYACERCRVRHTLYLVINTGDHGKVVEEEACCFTCMCPDERHILVYSIFVDRERERRAAL